MFKNHAILKLPNQKDILEYITDIEIFEYYLGGIPKKPICSPLRDDKIPSFSVFMSHKYDKLFYNDFATKECGDVFVFVMRLFGYHKITDAFMKIASDFNLTQFQTDYSMVSHNTKSYVKKENRGKVRTERINIRVKLKEWSQSDTDYWYGNYGLTEAQVKYCGVYPISHFFLNDYCKVTEKIAYAFVEYKDGLQTFKIYQPFSKTDKWINNNDYSTWELWTQMPKTGENLVITSSRKDAMVIKTMYQSEHVTSCSLQSEGVNPKKSVIDELKGRFPNIYVLYDNDHLKKENWGQLAGNKLCVEYNLTNLVVPQHHTIKDISDFRHYEGFNETKELMDYLLWN
jgi:hypothetical protein